MAFTSGGSGGLTNEINVTPMIDVLLVLLIIFMAAIPTMRKSIDVQLPDPTPVLSPSNPSSNQIVLEVNGDGTYSINSEKVTEDRLGPRLKEIYDPRPEKIIFVKGDPKAKYGQVVHAMDVSRGSGVKVIGVPPKDTPGSGK
jgi:biopolymer transport protein TolR